MNLSLYQTITDSNQWLVLWPEVALGLLAMLLLILELGLPRERHDIIPRVAIFGQLFTLLMLLGWILIQATDEPELTRLIPGALFDRQASFFDGLIAVTPLGDAGRVFILITSLLVSYLAQIYFKRQTLPRVEFYHITIVVAAAMMLLVQSTQFVLFFVALETVTVGFYVLVAYCRTSPLSLEAGLKYLILGALSSAILLFGIVLLYGFACRPELNPVGSHGDAMSFDGINRAMASYSEQAMKTNHDLQVQARQAGQAYQPVPLMDPLALTGVILVLCGVAFKIAAVPFQIWVPDVYQGAPTPTTAYLAVGSKAVGFLVLLNLVTGPFHAWPMSGKVVVPLLSALAVLSILFGNLAALGQHNVKRVMGLSGIAHAGYLLMGVVAVVKGVPWAAGAVLFYLFTYLLGSMAVFGVMVHVAGTEDESQELEHFANLSKRQPFLGAVLAIGLGSLAGIPPLAGFIGKLLLFFAAFQAKLYTLLLVSIIGVVISIYYYFGWMREALFRSPGIPGLPEEPAAADLPHTPTHWSRVTLGLLAGATLLIGLYQGFF